MNVKLKGRIRSFLGWTIHDRTRRSTKTLIFVIDVVCCSQKLKKKKMGTQTKKEQRKKKQQNEKEKRENSLHVHTYLDRDGLLFTRTINRRDCTIYRLSRRLRCGTFEDDPIVWSRRFISSFMYQFHDQESQSILRFLSTPLSCFATFK